MREELKAFKKMIAEMNTVAALVEVQEIQAAENDATPATANEEALSSSGATIVVPAVSREVQSVFTAPSTGFFTP